jgi:hypothetical protein
LAPGDKLPLAGGDVMGLEQIRNDIKNNIGQTINTVYGPSLVVGITVQEDGSEYVFLKEFGEEDYCVLIEQWPDLLQ